MYASTILQNEIDDDVGLYVKRLISIQVTRLPLVCYVVSVARQARNILFFPVSSDCATVNRLIEKPKKEGVGLARWRYVVMARTAAKVDASRATFGMDAAFYTY